MSARDKLFRRDTLAVSFEHLRKSTKKKNWAVVGTDGVSISDFLRDHEVRIAELSRRLRSDTFVFSPLRPVFARKPGIEVRYRLICVPTVNDRIVQRALLNHLSDRDPCRLDNGVSFGFIRGKGVGKAVSRAKELRRAHPFAYKTDITSFFDNISRDILRQTIRRRVKERSLHPLLYAAMDCEVKIHSDWEFEQIKKVGIRTGVGVRQGMPLSPFFANLLLVDFDRAVEVERLRMVRYADDLIFFCDSDEECDAAHTICSVQLAKLGLTVPDVGPGSKSRIFSPDSAAEFLGVELVKSGADYRLEVSEEQQKAVQEVIMRYADGQALLERGLTLTSYGKSLESTVAGYRSSYAYCDNFELFDQKLVAWKVTATERLLKKWLRVPIDSLSPSQRAFLELLPDLRQQPH